MGFLFPLFLLAAASLLIPLFIHLYNLRKFKQVFFPDIRFLRDLQLATRRQSKVQHWWLLLLRMLFLAALVLAFAQPYINSGVKDSRALVQAIFIDNSYSMTAAKGPLSLLDKSKSVAMDWIRNAPLETRFVVMSHDRTSITRAVTAKEAEEVLQSIQVSAQTIPLSSILNKFKAAEETEQDKRWAYFLFTDLQAPAMVDSLLINNKDVPPHLNIYLAQHPELSNLSIDTCYFLNATIDSRQASQLVVEIKHWGKTAIEKPLRLQLLVNQQVRAIKELTLNNQPLTRDTILLQLSDIGWQQLSVIIEDPAYTYDDTFRLATKVSPQLQVMVIGEQSLQPYLQTAFSYKAGFNLQYHRASAMQSAHWTDQNLIVIQDLSVLTDSLIHQLSSALERGQQVLLFPGPNLMINAVNSNLAKLASIQFGAADTSKQQVVQLHEQHPLLQGIFESVPDNVELPTTLLRYPLSAGLNAQQQTLMSYRDGTPFLAQYTIGRGKLFVSAAPLADRYSNFALSTIFVPILYKMAIQNSAQQVYTQNIGDNQPLWMPMKAMDSRTVIYMRGEGFEGIPAQQPSGSGLNVYAADKAQQPGFYNLHAAQTKDSIWVGMNIPAEESVINFARKKEIEDLFPQTDVTWLSEDFALNKSSAKAGRGFPLWKICVGVALLCLLLETWLLIRKKIKLTGSKEATKPAID